MKSLYDSIMSAKEKTQDEFSVMQNRAIEFSDFSQRREELQRKNLEKYPPSIAKLYTEVDDYTNRICREWKIREIRKSLQCDIVHSEAEDYSEMTMDQVKISVRNESRDSLIRFKMLQMLSFADRIIGARILWKRYKDEKTIDKPFEECSAKEYFTNPLLEEYENKTLLELCPGIEDVASMFGMLSSYKKTLEDMHDNGVTVKGFYDKAKKQIDGIENNTAIAAARRLKDLRDKSKGGLKTAKSRKEERGEDKTRKAILNEVNTALKNRDVLYRNKQKRPKDQSNNAIYRRISGKHMGENGKPIMSPGAIKIGLMRRNEEPRGKHDRAGKKRGKYNKSK